jgi:hypothetical protein
MSIRPLVLCLVPFLAAFGSCEDRNIGSLIPGDQPPDGGGQDAAAAKGGQGGGGDRPDTATPAGGGGTFPGNGGAIGADAASMIDCPSVAGSCPTGCTGISGAPYDQERMCFDYSSQTTLACVPEGSPPPPPTIDCARRLQDGALFFGDPRLAHMPGWTACSETMALTTCPTTLTYGIRVELSYGPETGKKGVTLRWQDGAPGATGVSGTFALLDRRFATFEELAAWKGSYEVAVAGKLLSVGEVSNLPCHEIGQRNGFDEHAFHVSRFSLAITPDETSVVPESHVPFDGPLSCYRALEAGAPAFGAVDKSQRTLRYWLRATEKDNLILFTYLPPVPQLPERVALLTVATDSLAFGISYAVTFPLSTPADAAGTSFEFLTNGRPGSAWEGRFDHCQAGRADLYVQERDLMISTSGLPAFDPAGRTTCCYGDGCSTATP